MSTTRQQVWGTCTPCSHTWVVAYLPMELSKAAKLMSAARCPKCGEGGLKMASEADIETALKVMPITNSDQQLSTPRGLG